jgi:hypothetical protein
MDTKLCLLVILTCISLMKREVEYIFMCLLDIYIIFCEEMSIQVWFIFKLSLFLLLSCRDALYILDISTLSDMWLANIFSSSIGCLSILLIFLAVLRFELKALQEQGR